MSHGPPRCLPLSELLLAAGLLMSGIGQLHAQTPDSRQLSDPGVVDQFADTSQSRGSVWIAYQTYHTGGLIFEDGVERGGTTSDADILRLGVDYLLNDRWEVHASVPFIHKRSNGQGAPHQPALLDRPHPESQFLDDGLYHSTWQDWSVGLSYHTQWGRFRVEPEVTLEVPSHDYTFFADAAVGQDLWKLDLGIDFSRQLEASNLYYSFGYSYVVEQQTLGKNVNKNHLRGSLGYFFSPRISARLFANGSYGKGYDASEPPGIPYSEQWYHHDQMVRHNYAIVGIGGTWQVNDDYALSLSAATMVWGRTVTALKRVYQIQLSKRF